MLSLCTCCFAFAQSPATDAASAPVLVAPGLNRAGFDARVRPQDDLFRAANGQWLKDTPIPGDKSDYGTFIQLRDRADERVRKIVEELAANASPVDANEKKIGTYYRSYMDEAAIDQAGIAPAKPVLAQVDAVKTPLDLARLFGRLQGSITTPMMIDVDADAKEPTVYRAATWQDGLGMPTRSYYFDEGERFAKARAAYVEYLQALFTLAGDKSAGTSAQAVFALEKRLAQAHWTPVENRDSVKTYNPMTLAALNKRAPGFAWNEFFKAGVVSGIDRVSISQPSYAVALGKAVREVPLATWKLYMRARVLDSNALVLPKPYRDAHFAFHGKALQGNEEAKPRWQQATASLGGALGEAVGQAYVARHFPPAYKARMGELVQNLLGAYGDSIDGLAWMGPQTRLKAKEKLAKYGVKIGYPDKWRDYSALELREGDAFGNRARASRFNYERQARRNGQPVDRTEWGMTPQTVNAYYHPYRNEIVFPAAILEPPFFDMAADDAVNYGAIGAIIGHEISHGFDDQGSQFDGDGKLQNWWTDADRKAFDALGAQLVAQYDAYEPLPGHKLNGKLTLGENIADLSGLQVAYKAYHRALAGKPAPVIDSLTGDQRFFLAWSMAWRSKARESRTLQLLTLDPHSPAEFRANGAAVNHDGFHDSFGTQPGDGMYKPGDARIRIW
jgi:putative endopeptidase